MSEANNNSISFSSESNKEFVATNNQQPKNFEAKTSNSLNTSQSEQKMNWQKVAHKLREYNRKLLKQVFRLEQELAEVNNKFNKHTEKSQNSDLLVAQQESELQNYQKQIAILTQHLTASQKQIEQKEHAVNELSQQYELSQQETARLERDCTLLQEKYTQNSYELIAKEQENQKLQEKLNQQQRSTLQYQAELKRDREKRTIPSKTIAPREPVVSTRHQYSSAKSIQPWSNSNNNFESKIALPKTKAHLATTNKNIARSSATVKTAAEITTWSASEVQSQQKVKTKTNNKPKSTGGKPQSLAAVDLPSFPRPL